MRMLKTFSVAPLLPNRLKVLQDLAHNIWWCWHPNAIDLFRRLDNELWEQLNHNPVALLGTIDQEKLKSVSEDEGFLAHMQRVMGEFEAYMSEPRWFQKTYPEPPKDITGNPMLIAYFSAEFGMTDCLPVYSGGLGVLAGDHLKSASDLSLPLVGVGLLYSQGYFRQYLNADGWQQEAYPFYDYANTPAEPYYNEEGMPTTIELDYPDRKITVQVWQVKVGRVKLFLLDTNLPSNSPADREITARLYGGDLEMRIKQEVLLGIGGIRVLAKIGLNPTVCHINEGHSAFLVLERIRNLMVTRGLSFEEAREVTTCGNVFTTHTPVPAGNDVFPSAMMDKYFSQYYSSIGLSRKQFMALGRQNANDENEPFCMTVLALRLAAHSNGVSRLHGDVSRRMWQRVWPDVPVEEVPIKHITNGIHISSWISHDMVDLLERYLGLKWREDPADRKIWDRVNRIPDAELWRTHERRRERLVEFSRRRLRQQLIRRGATKTEIMQSEEALDPEALTIGFARRFATYKRGTLLMRDMERFIRLLSDQRRPVQIIFAGKAHPRDAEGKDLIRQIIHLARREDLRRRVVFLEDYDINVARSLVQGVDVWLNTPRRPMEASGTSGMKVACNGGLNMSILDGWWDEGYNTENGWAIGSGEMYDDSQYQDQVESQAIYDTLEKEVVPLFYDRGPDNLPRKWIEKMKGSLATLSPEYNTSRMVQEYAQQSYVPAAEWAIQMTQNDYVNAIGLSKWKQGLYQNWAAIRFDSVEQTSGDKLTVGNQLEIRASVRLGDLKPDDIEVQLYTGRIDGHGQLSMTQAVPMECINSNSHVHLFKGSIPCDKTGIHGYGVRVVPKNKDLRNPYEPGLILWA
ncbi:MAG: alpha-glucan family phosphorylase [Phycisphaerae bacterium]